MTFKYEKFASGVVHPIIPITLKAGDHIFSERGLVDSGADSCIFDISIAKKLSLRLKQGRKVSFRGIGKGVGYVHGVEIEVGDVKYKTMVVFSNLNKLGVGILGQQGFFDHFDVTLSYKNQAVELRPV